MLFIGHQHPPLSRDFPSGAAFVVESAVLELLESFHDQLLKLLRLPGVSLHLLQSKTGLKSENLLGILCLV